jgi:hypothetical protein
MKGRVITIVAAAWAFSATSVVADSPIQISLWSPVQIVNWQF